MGDRLNRHLLLVVHRPTRALKETAESGITGPQCHNRSVKRQNDRTGAGGAAIVSMILNLDMAWIYRAVDQAGTDYGVDAHIEVTDADGVETGRQIAAQVKTGKHFFKKKTDDGFVHRPEDRHVRYWKDYALPVILILVDPRTREAYWEFTDHVTSTGKGWKIVVPRANVFGASAKATLSTIAVGHGTERTRAQIEQNEFVDGLQTRIADLEGIVASYVAQLAGRPATPSGTSTAPSIDILELPFAELLEWTDHVDFATAGVPAASRTAYTLAAQHLFFRPTITQHEAAQAVTLLLLAHDWEHGGPVLLYSLSLAKALPRDESPSIIDYRMAASLPGLLPLDIRIVIRAMQIAARRAQGRSVDGLLSELDGYIERATPHEGLAVTIAAFNEARAVKGRAPARAIEYIRAAALLRPAATGPRGTPFPTSVDATWSLMLELTAGAVATADDLARWFAALDAVPVASRDAVIHDEMNVVTLANRFWLDASKQPGAQRDWPSVHRVLERIEEWSASRSAALLFAAARRGRIVVRGEYEHDLEGALALAEDMPAFVRDDGHAEFLLREIAASQYLYAGAYDDAFRAFARALEVRPAVSSIVPTTLLKAAQAAAAANETAAAVTWAREAVDATRATAYATPIDLIIAHGEHALAEWTNGAHERGLDLWDAAAEALFTSPEDGSRWRGLVARFHWIGGYLATTYRTGTPPRIDPEGRPYGEPRPGALLIDLAGESAGYSVASHLGALLGMAVIADQRQDDARARRWAYASLEFATTNVPSDRHKLALLVLPHLIADGRYDDAVALGRDMVLGWNSEQFLPGADGRIVAMSFSIVPAVLAIASLPADRRTDAATRLVAAFQSNDDATWHTCRRIIEAAFLSTTTVDARRAAVRSAREADATRLSESPLGLLCDLASSVLPHTPAEVCVALHARALGEVHPRLSIYPTMYRLHVTPFFERFWRERLATDPGSFTHAEELARDLDAVSAHDAVGRPRSILLAVARAVRLT
jgi:tetratricopeptide (TPR) repeat protein